MSNTRAILLGALIGGGVGYVVGSIIADYVAPEYYTDEELAQLDILINDMEYQIEQEEATPNKPKKHTATQNRVDYTQYYDKSKGSVETLAKRASRHEEDEEEPEEDMMYDDEGDYDDEEINMYNDIPIIDEEDLSQTDPEVYISMRDTNVPYIMTEDEFEANESGLRQETLLYYPEDDVLTTPDNRPVDSIERVIGPYAISNMGVYSVQGDRVFVCNPKLGIEYAVVEQEGSYQDVVVAPPRTRTVNVFEERDRRLKDGDDS